MAIITPTILAENSHVYRTQIERVKTFVDRIHIDLADGKFAKRSIDLERVWLPEGVLSDVHVMYEDPVDAVDFLVGLKPHLIILHAESKGHFVELAEQIHKNNIKVGVALMEDTEVSSIEPAIAHIDHVLIFSGKLGHFGGAVNFRLLDKITELRMIKHDLEIGWDGGINDDNIERLASNNIDVLNVGGYIQRSEEPEQAYAKLKKLLKDNE